MFNSLQPIYMWRDLVDLLVEAMSTVHFWTLLICVLVLTAAGASKILAEPPSSLETLPPSRTSARVWLGEAIYMLVSVAFLAAVALLWKNGLADFEFARHTGWFVPMLVAAGASLLIGLLGTTYTLVCLAEILHFAVTVRLSRRRERVQRNGD